MGDPMANQSNPGKSESKSGAVPEWWPPLRARLAERLRQHQENQRSASRKRLPRECEEWIKEAKAAGIIPGKRRTGGVTPDSFKKAYEDLLSSLEGELSTRALPPESDRFANHPLFQLLTEHEKRDDDGDPGGVLVWFGSQEGILTKQESKRLAELKQKPCGWLRRDPSGREPGLLAITRSEHEQLKKDRPKLLEGVEVMEIPEDEERERLHLTRKLQEARVTEICFAPDFDTGNMRAIRFDRVPDGLRRKECFAHGRGLWRRAGSPAPEVVVVERVLDLVDRLKQKKPEEGPEKAETEQALINLVKMHPDRREKAMNAVSAIRRSQSALAAADKEIYRDASPNSIRALNEALMLANDLQRPPTRRELMNKMGWEGGIKEFTNLLRAVGLAWLREDHAAKGKRRV